MKLIVCMDDKNGMAFNHRRQSRDRVLAERIMELTENAKLDLVTQKLRCDYGISVQRFTAEEDLKERQNIKEYFKDGLYQVITAIKCLDEGVNIPGIQTAFILSSSRNPKEFIQRRGRLLRRSEGKVKAIIVLVDLGIMRSKISPMVKQQH